MKKQLILGIFLIMSILSYAQTRTPYTFWDNLTVKGNLKISHTPSPIGYYLTTLDTAGTLGFTSSAGSGPWVQTINGVSLNDTTQNVGIGTAIPTNNLQVFGTAQINDNVSYIFFNRTFDRHYPFVSSGNTSKIIQWDNGVQLEGDSVALSIGTPAPGGVLTCVDVNGLATWGSAPWGVNGNAGTDPTINFIGTTDGQPLMFRINNNQYGSLGYNGNIFYGLNAGNGLNAGYDNVGIGDYTMYNVTGGSQNLALGVGALETISSAQGNVGIGAYAGGGDNGYGVRDVENYNTFLGGETDISTAGITTSTALGYGAITDQSNQLSISVAHTNLKSYFNGYDNPGYILKTDGNYQQYEPLTIEDVLAMGNTSYLNTISILDTTQPGINETNFAPGYIEFVTTAGNGVKITGSNPVAENTLVAPSRGTNTDYIPVSVSGVFADITGNINLTPNGATGSEPSSPYLGQFYFDTTLTKMKFWNGTVWAIITSTP